MSNQGPAVDQSECDELLSPCQVDRSALADTGRKKKTNSGQRNGDTSSSPDSGSINGDGNLSSKSRRRRKRSSNPSSSPEMKHDKTMNIAETQSATSPEPCAGLAELKSECANVWFERSIYERAESLYQCWLASSSPVASNSPSMKNSSPAPSNVASTSSSCHHSEQVACHHILQSVWVNKTAFDQAECHFVESVMQLSVPNSLNISSPPHHPIISGTPDEGYQSLAPTPATPVVPQAAPVTPTRESINGLPRIPVELLRDVWLEKPQYDRAEATFYQNLCNNNSSKRPTCSSTSRNSDHPQSLVEEEEEDEEEVVVVVEKRLASQCKAEVFHALHPIQEEEEPVEVSDKEETPAGSGTSYFLHPDSERTWMEKWRYDTAEKHFYCNHRDEAIVTTKSHKTDADASDAIPPTLCVKTMSGLDFLAQERIWFDKPRYDDAERRFYERMNGTTTDTPQSTGDVGATSILQDIARARENIQKSLAGLKNSLSNRGPGEPGLNQHSQFQSASASTSSNNTTTDQSEIISRINSLELENQSLHTVVEDLRAALSKLECRVAVLEKSPAPVAPAPTPSVPYTNGTTVQQKSSSTPDDKEEDGDADDDFDLFGSDEDEEADQIKQQRLKEYAERKAKKPALIAKSSILLDVKPWDDETDMAKLEECVRSVQADGLLWGTSKLVPVGYGIKKLQIACVVEDDKVGTDLLEEEITKFEDYVQSVDVAAFNKI